MNWKTVNGCTPPFDLVINTKIDDYNGCRNEQKLVFDGKLWWLPNKSMYVYYTPTHWCYDF